MSLPSPTLSYIGACDTSSTAEGSVMFNIFFDPSITLLMFEYAIQPTSSFGTTANVVSGFIHTETCTQSGINNQYVLPIPAQEEATSPTSEYIVRVRVYDANTGEATLWSNQLNMYYPPPKPVIINAYYEDKALNAYDDGLYVLFTNTIAPFDGIVSYYYTDTSGDTQWAVTPPSTLTEFSYLDPSGGSMLGRYLFIPLGNDVSYNSPIYVAAHSAYSWTSSGSDYYAVSEVTSTITAESATYAAPVMNDVVYNVYTSPLPNVDPSAQTVNLSWNPPIPSSDPLDLIIVDYYNVKISYYNPIDGSANVVVIVNAPTTTLNYDLPNTACGTTYSFTVSAVTVSGQETDDSNVKSINVYKYPTAPTNLEIAYAFFEEDSSANKIDMLFSFTNPISNGCGGSPFFEYVVKDGSGNVIQNATEVPYFAGVAPYIVTLDGLVSDSINVVVEVYMNTTDTNSSSILAGPKTTDSYSIVGSPYIDNASVDMYNVLTFRVQTPTFLDLVNNVVCVGSGSPTVVNWTTGGSSTNVLSLVRDSINEVWVYEIEVLLPSSLTRVIINAANSTGIGHLTHVI